MNKEELLSEMIREAMVSLHQKFLDQVREQSPRIFYDLLPEFEQEVAGYIHRAISSEISWDEVVGPK